MSDDEAIERSLRLLSRLLGFALIVDLSYIIYIIIMELLK